MKIIFLITTTIIAMMVFLEEMNSLDSNAVVEEHVNAESDDDSGSDEEDNLHSSERRVGFENLYYRNGVLESIMFEFAVLKELHQYLSASTSSYSVNSVEDATADVADELVKITTGCFGRSNPFGPKKFGLPSTSTLRTSVNFSTFITSLSAASDGVINGLESSDLHFTLSAQLLHLLNPSYLYLYTINLLRFYLFRTKH
jgi:uncharacterized protein YxeA